MEWIKTKDRLPEENETVWAYNSKTRFIRLAWVVGNTDSYWFWAISNGCTYAEGDNIVSEADIDDDYEFTHWLPLPKLPKED